MGLVLITVHTAFTRKSLKVLTGRLSKYGEKEARVRANFRYLTTPGKRWISMQQMSQENKKSKVIHEQ